VVCGGANLYGRLFRLNRCLEEAAEILEQFRQEEVIHPEYAGERRHALEDLRADLGCVLTGMLNRRELETRVGLARREIKAERKTED
jgi:hypothetical protein